MPVYDLRFHSFDRMARSRLRTVNAGGALFGLDFKTHVYFSASKKKSRPWETRADPQERLRSAFCVWWRTEGLLLSSCATKPQNSTHSHYILVIPTLHPFSIFIERKINQ